MSRFKMCERFYEKRSVHYTKVESNMFDLVYTGNYEVIRSRIKSGTSVNLRNDQDQTLLHYAVLYNQVKIAKLLISFGADLNAKDEFGQTVRDVIQRHTPELYNEYTEYSLQLPEQETIEIKVTGSIEDSGGCCMVM